MIRNFACFSSSLHQLSWTPIPSILPNSTLSSLQPPTSPSNPSSQPNTTYTQFFSSLFPTSMTSSPGHSNKWMSFFDDNLLEDVAAQPSNDFFWCQAPLNEQADCSIDNDCCKRDSEGLEKICARKRSRDDPCSGPGTKACREKMRRDRLNDRFVELSALLEPGRPAKTDKATILSDTLRILNQLRNEAQQFKDSNHQLRESIKELKAEKNELRDEKLRLKAEKEKLDQQIKLMMIPSGYLPHPAAMHAAMATFAAQNQTAGNKSTPISGYPSMSMWQWMPPGSLDTSQDHMLRPPVA